MAETTGDYSKIKEYQADAANKNNQAAGLVGASFTLGDKVMEAVRADRVQRGVSKLATDTGNVMGQLVTDPNQIRQTAGASGLVDPFSVNALTSGARAQNLRTLGTVAQQGKENQGSIDEVVQAGANQLKARAAALQAEAEKELAKAQALQDDFERNLKDKQFNEGVREFNVSQANKGGPGGTTREKNFGDLADDANGFKQEIAKGTTTVSNAKYILKQTYPWASDEDINKVLGLKSNAPASTPAASASKYLFPGQPGYDITKSNFQTLGDKLRSALGIK